MTHGARIGLLERQMSTTNADIILALRQGGLRLCAPITTNDVAQVDFDKKYVLFAFTVVLDIPVPYPLVCPKD